MSVRIRLAALGLILAAGGAAGCQEQQKPLRISCTTGKDHVDVIGLDLRRAQATLMSVSPPLTGTAKASSTEYEILFQPGPDGASRLGFRINRYTFRVTRELGSRTVDSAAGTGETSTGTCERYRAKPL